MVEYKYIVVSESKLEEQLNLRAKQGWEVKNMFQVLPYSSENPSEYYFQILLSRPM